MIENTRVGVGPPLRWTGTWDLLMAPGTFPFLFQEEKSPHLTDGGALLPPVYRAARRAATDGIGAGWECRPFAAADRAGIPCEALLLFGRVGIPAVFPEDHGVRKKVSKEENKAGDRMVKV